MSTNHVLLASHGTDGAKAAEQMAIQLCEKGAKIHHLVVVPTFWEGMTGDDWLNNGSTRDRFRRYLESELEKEVAEHCERILTQAEQNNITYTNEVVIGEPEQCLLEASNKADFDLIVMGSPRPKGIKGLRSKMATESVTRSLRKPVLIVPYPHD